MAATVKCKAADAHYLPLGLPPHSPRHQTLYLSSLILYQYYNAGKICTGQRKHASSNEWPTTTPAMHAAHCSTAHMLLDCLQSRRCQPQCLPRGSVWFPAGASCRSGLPSQRGYGQAWRCLDALLCHCSCTAPAHAPQRAEAQGVVPVAMPWNARHAQRSSACSKNTATCAGWHSFMLYVCTATALYHHR